MCPTIGASAQECSTLIPIFPLGYEISVNDLSNHLRKERTERTEIAPDVLQPFTVLFSFLPVITLSVKQGFGITIKRAGLCLVVTLWLIIESQKEGSRLDSIQGSFVYTLGEILSTGPGPWNSEGEKISEWDILFYLWIRVTVLRSPVPVSCSQSS